MKTDKIWECVDDKENIEEDNRDGAGYVNDGFYWHMGH